jgi:1-deoxy-D-xylulose-5-phosphate synthase
MELSKITSPEQLKSLDLLALQKLANEIRKKIISVCLKNGGHIGASLGTVELTLALHQVFSSPQDAIFWDVGHQAYAHKLLTGRHQQFETLRQTNGLSGFLSRTESEHDVFGAGHSSTSISAMLGYAFKNPNWSVAVIGDGGLTAGLAFEALNQVSSLELGPSLIVLNDNQMSISKNVGGISQILSEGRAPQYFELFGVQYIGPIDGHDLSLMISELKKIHAHRTSKPVLLHVRTQKGRGYAPAEISPALFHGVGPSQPVKGSWSEEFVAELILKAHEDPKIVAVTAAMSEGTGLFAFEKVFPDRFFDVGIAEAHAVTFAAGLAARGWKPIVAIYSTFLQRAFDSIIHDVALQKLPVVFAIDRAGLVGADGPTHHGAFDIAYGKMIPGLKMFAPEGREDLSKILTEALSTEGPSFIRYPRGVAPHKPKAIPLQKTTKLAISIGSIGVAVASAIAQLKNPIDQVHMIQLKPIDPEQVRLIKQSTYEKIFIFEEGAVLGGIGETLRAQLDCSDVEIIGIPDRFISHGSVSDLENELGLSVVKILEKIL